MLKSDLNSPSWLSHLKCGYVILLEYNKVHLLYFILFFKNILFTDSWETQREREAERDAGSPMWDSILGSHPEPKADAQPLSHPGILYGRIWILFSEQ